MNIVEFMDVFSIQGTLIKDVDFFFPFVTLCFSVLKTLDIIFGNTLDLSRGNTLVFGNAFFNFSVSLVGLIFFHLDKPFIITCREYSYGFLICL